MFEEDDNPVVEPVKGVKFNGTRYNSQKGFVYYRQKFTKTSVTYHCKYHKAINGNCKARISMVIESGLFTKHGPHPHNHPPEPEEQQLLQVVNACVDAVPHSRARPKEIFDAVRRDHPGVAIGYGESMQRRMQRSKRRRQPPIPKTVAEAAECISNYPEYRDAFEGGEFYKGHIKTTDGDALLFLSPKLLPELSETTELQADGTFRTVPCIFKQLFTIHITRFGKAFPFAFALMTNKTRNLYDAVIRKTIDIFDFLYPDRLISVELVMSDYETAIQGSMKDGFDADKCVGCFFHYSQAIWRRVQKHGLQCAYMNRPTVEKYVKEVIALAYLPSNEILNGFHDIKAHYSQLLRRESPAVQQGIKHLNTYFLTYWIGEVQPEVFSVFGLINRTNNLVECWHSWLSKRMGTSHLNFWDFLYFLKEAENSKARDYEAESVDISTTRRQPLAQCERNAVISQNERDLNDKQLTLRQFLKKSRNLTEPNLNAPRRRPLEDNPIERPIVQPRRRFLAGTVRAAQPAVPRQSVEQPVEELHLVEDVHLGEEMLPTSETPIARQQHSTDNLSDSSSSRRSSRVPVVPRHLAEDGESPVTPPSRRVRLDRPNSQMLTASAAVPTRGRGRGRGRGRASRHARPV